MRKKVFLYIYFPIIIIFTIILLIKYRIDSPKRIIKNEIIATKKAIETENRKGTTRYLSEDFTYERFNRENIEPQIDAFFREFDKISLKMSDLKINIEGEKAKVTFKLLLMVTASGITGPVVGEILNPASISCTFTKNSEWLLDSIAIYENTK